MEEREQKSGGVGCFIVALMLLPVLYVLSVGPAAWLADQNPALKDFLEAVYKPLEFVALKWNSAGRFFSWYIELWV